MNRGMLNGGKNWAATMFKYLRITAAIGCLAASTLLIVLWIRSYSRIGVIQGALSSTRMIQVVSHNGRLMFSNLPASKSVHWSIRSLTKAEAATVVDRLTQAMRAFLSAVLEKQAWSKVWHASKEGLQRVEDRVVNLEREIKVLQQDARIESGMVVANKGLGFRFHRSSKSLSVGCPHWFPVLVCGAMAVAFGYQRQWRFSLRALLILMTMISLVLGLCFAF